MKQETKETAIFLGKAVGVAMLGAIGGLGIGTMAGRVSAPLGVASMSTGFYVIKKFPNKDLLGYFMVSAGAGMIASPLVTMSPSDIKGLKGIEGLKEDAVGSAKMAMSTIAQKFWIDKTPLARFIPKTLSGLGNSEEYVSGLKGLGASDLQAEAVLAQMIQEQKDGRLNGQNLDKDYMAGLGMSKLERDFSGVLDISEIEGTDGTDGIGELSETDQDEMANLVGLGDAEMGEADSDLGEIGKILRRKGMKMYPLNIPANIEEDLEKTYGAGKVSKFKARANKIGERRRARKAGRKGRKGAAPVGDLYEAYPMLAGTLAQDYNG